MLLFLLRQKVSVAHRIRVFHKYDKLICVAEPFVNILHLPDNSPDTVIQSIARVKIHCEITERNQPFYRLCANHQDCDSPAHTL